MLKILIIVNAPKEIQTEVDYQEKYKQFSDAEIREILLLRNSYQEKAAQAAIQEAISRGIIQSEQDLFSEAYRQPTNQPGRFFPNIRKPEQKERILSSIYRINYILGIIPFIFAGLNYSKGEFTPCVIFAGVGIGWMFLNFRLSKTKSGLLLNLMFALVILAFAYSIYYVYILKSPQVMDFAVTVIAFLIPAYCLLFARSILKN